MTHGNLASHDPLSTPALTCQNEPEQPLPALFDGVEAMIAAMLEISGLRHRSALLTLGKRTALPTGIVAAIHAVIAANWTACHAAPPVAHSNANWRWHKPQLGLGEYNVSPEVRLERELMGACARAGRADWSNQVPVASGIGGPSRQRRRAIDLVHRKASGHFQMIELKIASDTPLYAAIEIIGYASIWLLSRVDRADNVLLAANRMDTRVLAPAAYYARYELGALAQVLDAEVSALGRRHGIAMSFGFEQFADALTLSPRSDESLLGLLDHRQPI